MASVSLLVFRFYLPQSVARLNERHIVVLVIEGTVARTMKQRPFVEKIKLPAEALELFHFGFFRFPRILLLLSIKIFNYFS